MGYVSLAPKMKIYKISRKNDLTICLLSWSNPVNTQCLFYFCKIWILFLGTHYKTTYIAIVMVLTSWFCRSGWLGWLCAGWERLWTDILSTSAFRDSISDRFVSICDLIESISDCFEWFAAVRVWIRASNCRTISNWLENCWGSADKTVFTRSSRTGVSGLRPGTLLRHCWITGKRGWSLPISQRYSALRSTSGTGMIASGFHGSGRNASSGNGHLPQKVWMIRTP